MSRGFAPALAHTVTPVPATQIFADLICAYQEARQGLEPGAAALLEQALALANESQLQLRLQEERIRELESLSVTDSLTGLLNRRGFQDAMDRTLAACQRHGEDGVLAYIDLDGFKQVNDTFGHSAGDAMLTHMAALLKRTVRATDYIARLGGDEFAVLLPEAGPGELRAAAARLEQRLGTVAAASIGLAALPVDGLTAEDLHRAADADLYRAKQQRAEREAPRVLA
jgi:diguanylate cyclase (GGDEF)-like protein